MTDTSVSTSNFEAENHEGHLKNPKTGVDIGIEGISTVPTEQVINDDHSADPGDEEVDPNADLVPDSDLENDEGTVGDEENAAHIKVTKDVDIEDIDIDDEEAFKFKGYQYRAPSVSASSGGPSAARKAEMLRQAQQKQEAQRKKDEADRRRGGGSDASSTISSVRSKRS